MSTARSQSGLYRALHAKMIAPHTGAGRPVSQRKGVNLCESTLEA